MSVVRALEREEKDFLAPFLPTIGSKKADDLPFVTLTYATSLDGMIAGAPGARTTLSGPESKGMTHYLRLRHDAILIGAGTAAVDDPALNCRYPGATKGHQPRPVILDPNRRLGLAGKKVSNLAFEKVGKEPWMIARNDDMTAEAMCEIDENFLVPRKDAEEKAKNQKPNIPWRSILEALKHKGIDSVMIEGGATVINTLLTLPELVDSVIITIAPTFLGQGGVAVAPRKAPGGEATNAAWLQNTSWRKFGNDMVLCGNPKRA